MRVNESMDAVTFSQGETGQSVQNVKKSGTGVSVYGGNLNVSDPIAEKRKEAQQKAMKIVADAWESDKAIDRTIKKRQDHCAEMRELEKEHNDELHRIRTEKDSLKETYGIAEDSEEQKELELLEKRQAYMHGDVSAKLTDEELEQIKDIDSRPRTEYQQRALELNERAYVRQEELKDIRKYIADDIADVRSIQIERLKSHGMVDAQKSADAVLEAAGKEIIGMLRDEVKENIDEEQKENKEKAEKVTEEKEEKEEQLEALKEKRLIQEALVVKTEEAVERAKAQQEKNRTPEIALEEMVDMVQSGGQSAEVQKELDDIKNSMKLLEADLKGIQVDETV